MFEDVQELLIGAASMGNVEFVRKAIGIGADPKMNCSEALYVASERGHSECVEFLIPISDSADFASALKIAAFNGHADCVEHLMKVSDPKANHSMALQSASCGGQWECMRLLIPVSDLDDMKNDDEWLIQEHGIANLQAFIEEESLREIASSTKSPKPSNGR